MSDLALEAGPLTGLFPTPTSVQEWEPYALSREQVEAFEQFGFLADVPVLTDSQVHALREELTQLQVDDEEASPYFYEYHRNESADPSRELFHALGAWRVSPAFHDVLWNPAFLLPAYQLLGSGIRFFHDQLFSKPSARGGVVAWHQDYAYWTWTRPMAHLTCWMGLDDVSIENGCLTYVPGSHRWGLLERPSLVGDASSEMDAIRSSLTPEQTAEFERRVPIEMRAGHASFHHPLLVHGSEANRSDRPRRATLINVFADGVRSNRAEDHAPGTDGYPHVPRGESMGGAYYPLLFDPRTARRDPDLLAFLAELPKADAASLSPATGRTQDPSS